jgi:hypothetical protein
LPELRRQNDLALGGDGSLHKGKISSYQWLCQAPVSTLTCLLLVRVRGARCRR